MGRSVHFEFAAGSRDERMEKAATAVFVPTVNGALSSLIGPAMLGFSDFEFIRLYFFAL